MEFAIVVCVSILCFGLVNSNFCEEWRTWSNVHYVNVCQDDSVSVSYGIILVLEAAAAGAPPPQQDLTCNCYLSFAGPQQYMLVRLWIGVDGDHQDASYTIDGTVFNTTSYHDANITSVIKIIYRHEKQENYPRVCMGIYKNEDTGILTVRCERPSTTTSTRTTGAWTGMVTTNSTPELSPTTTSGPEEEETTSGQPGMVTTHSMPELSPTTTSDPEEEETTSEQPGIVMGAAAGVDIVRAVVVAIIVSGIVAGVVAGAVIVLAVSITIIVSVLRRKCKNSEQQPEQGTSAVTYHVTNPTTSQDDSEYENADVNVYEPLQDDRQDGHNYQAVMPVVVAPAGANVDDVHLYEEPRPEYENTRLDTSTYEPLQADRDDGHNYQAVVPDGANSEYEEPVTGEKHEYITVH